MKARRWLRAGAWATAAGTLAAGGLGALLWVRALAPSDPAGEPGLFRVRPGAGLRTVARELEAAGFVRRAWAWVWLARLRGVESGLRAGEYELSPAWPAERVLERIARGEIKTHAIVLPEGLTAREIATRLDAAGLVDAKPFLAVVQDPEAAAAFGVEGPTLEGYLFPETYRLPRDRTPREVAGILVEHFLATWRELAPEARARGLSMREVVTLASIVEKETAVAAERPLIASVFHNRLTRGMRLESDPTVIYGIPEFDGNLRRAHLEDATNPFNTYRITGLPPSPIANPGQASLEAVVRPADSKFLYFVSRNDGTHVFSRTYRDHAAAVDRYQRRGGR